MVIDIKTYLGWREHKEPITNADRIRAMTDEELADFMILFSDYVPNPDGKRRKDCWLDWLKQETKDG